MVLPLSGLNLKWGFSEITVMEMKEKLTCGTDCMNDLI